MTAQVPGQAALFRTCEIHANGALATHRVDFQATPDAFYVCRSCADDAVRNGLVAIRLDEVDQ